MPFSDDQIRMLSAPIDPTLVRRKPTPGNPPYIPGFVAIEAANKCFGYAQWGYAIERIDRLEMPGGVLYTAWVTVTVTGCPPKTDVGTEVASATKEGKPPSPQAHETAVKGSVTDGLKRALRSYGDAFGLSLYDKDADLGAEYAAWQLANDPRTNELRDAIAVYGRGDPEGMAIAVRKHGPLAGWGRATLEGAEPWFADRAKTATRMPPVEQAPTSGAGTSPEPSPQEMLAGTLDLARMAVERMTVKRGGPSPADTDQLRTILSDLQIRDPRTDDVPAAAVPAKALLQALAQRLPAPVLAGAPSAAADEDSTTPF